MIRPDRVVLLAASGASAFADGFCCWSGHGPLVYCYYSGIHGLAATAVCRLTDADGCTAVPTHYSCRPVLTVVGLLTLARRSTRRRWRSKVHGGSDENVTWRDVRWPAVL